MNVVEGGGGIRTVIGEFVGLDTGGIEECRNGILFGVFFFFFSSNFFFFSVHCPPLPLPSLVCSVCIVFLLFFFPAFSSRLRSSKEELSCALPLYIYTRNSHSFRFDRGDIDCE